MDKVDDFIVRKAQKEDCRNIYELIKEFHTLNDSEDKLSITSETLAEDGFGEHSFYQAVVAEKLDKQIIGYALFNYAYSTWNGCISFLQDIYVKKNFRNKGIGSALLKNVCKISLASGCTQCRLGCFESNKIAIAFFEKFFVKNLTALEEWDFLQIDSTKMKQITQAKN